LIDLWYKNAIIYAIGVRTFADGNGDGVGDFRGLADRLPYLRAHAEQTAILRVHV